ncbi:MAG: HipA domain-containing protein [Bacteroidota bacterium]|nr:HipA domain-containing protein [Bacteroidota bacterium]
MQDSVYLQPSGKLGLVRKLSIFTIIGLWGNYILKPPTESYPHICELEDLTMHIARILGIKTALHGLVPLASGEYAYLTKRFDRVKGRKLALEDMAQLTGVLTERKYSGSLEKVGKTILQYSSMPGNDIINFIEILIFSFITGNSDMHLKNFSLLTNEKKEVLLSPAYDLLPVKLLLPGDKEETALSMNGKKAKLSKKDFYNLGKYFGLSDLVISNIFKKFAKKMSEIMSFVDYGFIPQQLIKDYKDLIQERAGRLDL